VTLRTAVIGVGHLGRQHARVHAALAAENRSRLAAVCDINEETAQGVASERETAWTTDWRALMGEVDAVSLATPTESHAEIACQLLEAGVHVLVEKPISRTLEEADRMIAAAERGRATLMVGHLERFNPALVALRPHVRNPVYFEIHRVGEFTARSLDIDVVLDLMIHDLDIVLWLVGHEVGVTDVRAVGIPVLTNRVDAANARIEFASGAVANITASPTRLAPGPASRSETSTSLTWSLCAPRSNSSSKPRAREGLPPSPARKAARRSRSPSACSDASASTRSSPG